MQRIVNLTPHVLNLYDPNDSSCLVAVIPSEGCARVTSTPGAVTSVHFDEDGLTVPIAQPFQWGAIEGLPEPHEGVIYVVSLLVAQRAMRADVVSPGTGPNDNCIRDDQGRIAGVTRLIGWA